MKTCRICNVTKQLDAFHKASKEIDGKESRCKVCILEMKSKNYHKNLAVNREKSRVKALEFRKKNKGYQRKYDLKRVYNMSINDYDLMLEQQNSRCKICLTENAGGKHKKFYIDHCHKTGKVRGLLCTGCNLALGGFRDNIESLKRAIDYLTGKLDSDNKQKDIK